MFGIGLPEMIVIFAVALIVIGPDKLPDLARSLAKGLFELKRTLNEVRDNFSEEEEAIHSVREDLRKTAEDLRKKVMFDEVSPRQLPPPKPEPEAEADRLEVARRSGPPIPLPDEQGNNSESQTVVLPAQETKTPEVIDLPHTEQPEPAPTKTEQNP